MDPLSLPYGRRVSLLPMRLLTEALALHAQQHWNHAAVRLTLNGVAWPAALLGNRAAKDLGLDSSSRSSSNHLRRLGNGSGLALAQSPLSRPNDVSTVPRH